MFVISGIERAKRGEAQILVTFDLDANGILSVSATDKATGAKNQIVITSTTQRNSKEDVERMVADGERFASEDAKLQKKAEARRECEDAIFDLADDDAAPEKARDAAELAEEWLQSNFEKLSVDELKAKASELRGLARGFVRDQDLARERGPRTEERGQQLLQRGRLAEDEQLPQRVREQRAVPAELGGRQLGHAVPHRAQH